MINIRSLVSHFLNQKIKSPRAYFLIGDFFIFLGIFICPFSHAASSGGLDEKTVAKVNGVSFYESDLKLAAPGLNEGQKQAFLENPHYRKELLKELIKRELFAQEAKKLGLDKNPAFLKDLEAARKNQLSGFYFETAIASCLKEQYAKNYFEKNKGYFNTDRIHLQGILLKTETEANRVLLLAKDLKSDFQKLAELYSLDPMVKGNHGDMGFLTKIQLDSLDHNITNALFSAKQQMVGPVKTTSGFMLFKIIKKEMGAPLNFEDVKPWVEKLIREEKMKEQVDKLKKSAEIEIMDGSVF